MDSVSQMALGAGVAVAVMGPRVPLWKAALTGALAGTLPDLDVLIDYGDPIRNMTFHRGWSHALFWLSLASLPLAWLAARASATAPRWRRWWLALWLVLITHTLLDAMTIYGTQLWQPFSDYPVGLGSLFIIDPLYTLPLLIGLAVALWRRQGRRALNANRNGLILSTLYLCWSVLAQQQVQAQVPASLAAAGLEADRVLVVPTPFNTLVWRVLVIAGDDYAEGFYSLLDGEAPIHFERYPRGQDLYRALEGQWEVDRIAWFSHGFFRLRQHGDEVRITDLRMGQEPQYFFTFAVARVTEQGLVAVPPMQYRDRGDWRTGLRWLQRRATDATLPPLSPGP